MNDRVRDDTSPSFGSWNSGPVSEDEDIPVTWVDPRLGTTILGSFRLDERIGSGAFAQVYLATQKGTDRPAVVKVAHRHLVESGAADAILSRFAAEFKAASRVRHPNVATVFIAGTTPDGVPAIAMEYVKGRTLQSILEDRGALDFRIVLKLLVQLASTLSSIHAEGIIHRDLSPDNVMVTRRQLDNKLLFKILDFGVARLDGLPSRTAGPLGTPRYMAPEQLMETPCEASDIYSLGAITWWALSGREYLHQVDSMNDLIKFHVASPPVPSPILPANLPAELVALVRRMLDPDPEARPRAIHVARLIPDIWNRWISTQSNPSIRTTGEFVKAARISSSAQLDTVDQAAPKSANTSGSSAPAISARRSADSALMSTMERLDPAIRIELVQGFLGEMPQLLAELSISLESGTDIEVLRAASAIAMQATQLRASHMERLARAVGDLWMRGLKDDATGMFNEIENEYSRIFRILIRYSGH